MKEARIMKENITYYLVWIICLLAGCAPTPKQIEDTTDPIPMYPDYTDIMIPTNIAPLAQPGETGTLNLYIPDRKRRIGRSLREYRHSQ